MLWISKWLIFVLKYSYAQAKQTDLSVHQSAQRYLQIKLFRIEKAHPGVGQEMAGAALPLGLVFYLLWKAVTLLGLESENKDTGGGLWK